MSQYLKNLTLSNQSPEPNVRQEENLTESDRLRHVRHKRLGQPQTTRIREDAGSSPVGDPLAVRETTELAPTQPSSNEEESSMAEYYQLQKMLLLVTVALIGLIFLPVWYFYSLNTALNYLLGASVGLLYLRLLAKEVERLGQPNQRLGAKGLGIFIILIIVASKWQQLHILPVFLGFLTYKAAIVFYTLQITLLPAKKTPNNP